jgi:hypothetical protein
VLLASMQNGFLWVHYLTDAACACVAARFYILLADERGVM